MNKPTLPSDDEPEPIEDDSLSPGSIALYASHFAEGNIDPRLSKKMLRTLANQLRGLTFPTSPVNEELAGWFAGCVDAYLGGQAGSLEGALGLKKRGRPRDPEIEKRNVLIAVAILDAKEQGKSWLEIMDTIPKNFGMSPDSDERDVRRIYEDNFTEAASVVLVRRLAKSDRGGD
jgi:hypothetical protein